MTNSADEPDIAGARKTTLFHLITGQLKPTHRSIIFDGREFLRGSRFHEMRAGASESLGARNPAELSKNAIPKGVCDG